MAPKALLRLLNKVAIVTGGSSGIGAATVKKFREHGAQVVIADIQDAAGEALAAATGARYVRCDVSREADVAATVDFALEHFGTLDIMHNNAGIITGSHLADSFARLDMTDLDQVFAVNVKGVAHGVKHAARVMVPRGTGGSIISTASIAHINGGAFHPYTISKHAVVGITKSAATELAAYGIRVNSISPGGVVTGISAKLGDFVVAEPGSGATDSRAVNSQTDLRQDLMDPEEIAGAALFLASDDSRLISGHDVVVDGGASITGAFNFYGKFQQGLLRIKSPKQE